MTDLPRFYVMVVGFVALAATASWAIINSSYGRTLRAIRENEKLAASLGIDVGRHKIGAFVVSGVFAGVSGVLLGYFLGHISPQQFASFPSIYLALMVMIGGARLLAGPLAGGILVAFLPELLSLDPVESRIVYGVCLIAVILLLPNGLIAGIAEGFAKAVPPAGPAARRPFRRRLQAVGGAAMNAILDIRGLKKQFGGVTALAGVDLAVGEGEILGVVGPNGSGKTTLFNVVTGVHKPSGGSGDLARERHHRHRAACGLARRHRLHLPAGDGLCRPFRRGKRPDRLRACLGAADVRLSLADAASAARLRRPCTHWRTRRPAFCPSAACACSVSRWRWRRGHRCCCSTSRPLASTTRRRRHWSTWCGNSRRTASPSASSTTT